VCSTPSVYNLIKHRNAFFCQNFQLSQLLINSYELKHDVTRNSLLIIYIFNVISMAQQTFTYILNNKEAYFH